MSWHVNTGELLRVWSRKMYGDATKLPDKYVIIDLETTGLVPGHDHIAQIGVCGINGDQIVISSTLLDTPMEWFNPDALAVTGFTEELFKRFGQPREKSLHDFYEFLMDRLEEGYTLVGHNLLRFDSNFLIEEFKALGLEFQVPLTALDTGLMVKAAQLASWPEEFESFRDFLSRVDSIFAKGIYWKLTGFCDREFKLDDMTVPEYVTMMDQHAHDAGVDCLKVYFLLKRFRDYANDIELGALKIDDPNDPNVLFERLLNA